MLIKQVCQNNVIFVTICILKTLLLSMEMIFAMGVLMQKAMSFNNIAIVYIKGSAYGIHF